MKTSPLAKFLPFVFAMLLLAACGRPATEDECREILRRSAELELKGRLGNPALVKEKLSEIEASMQDSMMKKCVGKRITEDAMKCVRAAKTAEEITEECFK